MWMMKLVLVPRFAPMSWEPSLSVGMVAVRLVIPMVRTLESSIGKVSVTATAKVTSMEAGEWRE